MNHRPLRIAFVVHSLRVGGIERSVTRIVNGLDPNQFAPAIICMDRKGPAANWLQRDIPIVEVCKRNGNDGRALRRLASCLRTQRIDLVQSHNWGTLLETVLARKLARVPHHIHAERGTVLGSVTAAGLRHRLRARAMAAALKSVDQVISNAHSVADRVQQRCGYPARRIEVIPNGTPRVDHHGRRRDRHAIRMRLGIPAAATVIGSVGRLAAVKGFDTALKAFAEVLRRHPDTHLILVGDGPELPSLRAALSHMPVPDRVHLVGHRDQVLPWYAAMDLYMNSSRSEGLSQSIIEAMSMGLPILATDVGDNGHLVGTGSEACGLICPPDSAAELARAMQRLQENLSLRSQFSRSAIRSHAKYYSEERFHNRIEQLYCRVSTPSAAATAPLLAARPPQS